MDDAMQLAAMVGFFLLVLAVGGWFADRQDPDREDARRRNQARPRR